MKHPGPDSGSLYDRGASGRRTASRGSPRAASGSTRSDLVAPMTSKVVERDGLVAAVEQVAESIVITDTEARIVYVNAAFERVTGYARGEVIGRNPRFLQSGLQTPWFYDAMWAALTNGLPWAADLVNRRKDGSLFTEEAVISPVRDSYGAVTSYLAVKRDVTHERELLEHSSQLVRERALIGETIRSLRARDKPEATAQAICRRVVTLSEVTAAGLFLFGLDGYALPIGFVVAGRSDPPLRRLSFEHSRYLHERATQGPWIEPLVDRPSNPYNELMTGPGIHSVAYAPVRHDQRLIGLLLIDAVGGVDDATVTEALPALVEFADLAGALIGRDVAERTQMGRVRDRIATIIADGAFYPVFQPIVELGGREIVGYEALTRFADGADPQAVFAEAAAVGMENELETATLRASLEAAKTLSESAWLNVNASPGLILAQEPLRTMLAGSGRRGCWVCQPATHSRTTAGVREAGPMAGRRSRVR